jgi:transposase-like protein
MDKGKDTNQRPGAEFFQQPQTATQRQYEALRAYLFEGRSAKQVAERFGYAPATLYTLARELRAGRLRFFEPARPGPKKAPKRQAARQRVIELRKQNYSIYDIQNTETSVALRGLSRPLRQIAVCDLGHEEPTLFLTNDTDMKTVDLVERYAHRMLIENSIAQNVDFFHLDALSSAIAIQVDLDLILTLVANGLYRQLAHQLKGFEAAQPKQIFRRFLNTPARVSVSKHEVHVRIRRCAHHPLLPASGCLDVTPQVPWWQGRRLHLEIR